MVVEGEGGRRRRGVRRLFEGGGDVGDDDGRY